MKRIIIPSLVITLLGVMNSCKDYKSAMSKTEREAFFREYPQPLLGSLKATATKVTLKKNSTLNGIAGMLKKDSAFYVPDYFIGSMSVVEKKLIKNTVERIPIPVSWDLRLNAVVPAFKIFETDKKGRDLDGRVLTSIGSGLQIERFVSRRERGEANSAYRRVSTFSYSPLTVLLSGNGEAFLDVSLAQTIGLLNNTIQFGGGYDFGEVDADRKGRWFFLLSVGVNLNGSN
ncbi:MAG: hypothetical protein JKY48_13460 [Flavobacteriales bacterium]|nr:hypothetical protein [Flavobacteriales bacterium]